MTKKALVVGIANYANPKNNLPGVNNDIPSVIKMLTNFGITDIEVLRDANATAANVMKGMNTLVMNAQADDVRVFYFSGHGALLPPGFSGGDDPDGRDEALVPYEGTVSTLILDNWIATFLKTILPSDVSFWGLYDSCHSGDIFKAAEISGIDTDPNEISKEMLFTDLVLDSMPTRLAPSANADFTLKNLVLDGGLTNSFHFGASEAEKPALCKTIDSIVRSVFTFGMTEVATPGMTVKEFEDAVKAKMAEVTSSHTPQIACSEANKTRSLFS
jgi:hypothetical protein